MPPRHVYLDLERSNDPPGSEALQGERVSLALAGEGGQ